MGKEIEAKFININKEEIIKKLESMGAIKVFDERLLRKYIYNLPVKKEGAWARVRDEVDKITMTYKRVTSQSLDGVEEVEVKVDNFDKAKEFLRSVGLIEKAYQESKRIRYIIKDVNIEFDIDTWPGLEPWLEIEADTEEKVREYSSLLGFVWGDAMFGSADFVYAKVFNITEDWINNQCPMLCFDKIPFELTQQNKRK